MASLVLPQHSKDGGGPFLRDQTRRMAQRRWPRFDFVLDLAACAQARQLMRGPPGQVADTVNRCPRIAGAAWSFSCTYIAKMRKKRGRSGGTVTGKANNELMQ